ncbi:AAA family ATPase [Lentzea sp. NPDC055074]
MDAAINPAVVYNRIAANVQRVIQGKPDVVRLVLTALLAEGHVLIEDKPGLGKTTLAHCVARSVHGSWSRIQFTPDLLPSDITGTSMYHQGEGEFRFHPGPVFANIVLADEINRATPKTQSALLEVMAERQVTNDRQRYQLERPFMVVGTQNPIELAGTYRLPEAQLDRFLMRVSMGYPQPHAEVQVLLADSEQMTPDRLPSVVELRDLAMAIEGVRRVHADSDVCAYIVQLATATREHADVLHGVSPRGSVALLRAARAWASIENRDFVVVDDVKQVAHAVFEHRLILTPEAELARRTAADVVRSVLAMISPVGSRR